MPEISQVKATQTNFLVDVYTRAFFDDPVFSWIFPDPARRAEANRRFFRVIVDSTFAGGGLALQIDDFDAVSLFYPPSILPSAQDHADLVARLESDLGEDAERAIAFMNLLNDNHPRDLPPHLYGTFLSAVPGRQGKGLGTRLKLAQFALADGGDAGVYGEASCLRNLALYERLGQTRLGGPITLRGGPSLYPIWRPQASQRPKESRPRR
ncbi:GNAT family N-acetyltransferase [Amycolatopsis sp. Hca4]|uniref:GNAT family N-acetyltransferase n=1 Tax=Amycolatopsis sp. Hca4 TaxID=2742131 RepID=UPI00158FC9E1|nr:GNAT family N-acetyltransferase [Amycolatopsis sp. Hca4]QKV74071.1 GNAT family N-acetyltransferase [Amycolatopsis sp. Hca4]